MKKSLMYIVVALLLIGDARLSMAFSPEELKYKLAELDAALSLEGTDPVIVHTEIVKGSDKIIAAHPDSAHAYFRRADSKYLLKDYPGAFADAKKVIELDPNNPTFAYVYYIQSLLLFDLDKNVDASFKSVDKAIALNPKVIVFYSMRGFLNDQLGNKERADADFATARQLTRDLESSQPKQVQ